MRIHQCHYFLNRPGRDHHWLDDNQDQYCITKMNPFSSISGGYSNDDNAQLGKQKKMKKLEFYSRMELRFPWNREHYLTLLFIKPVAGIWKIRDTTDGDLYQWKCWIASAASDWQRKEGRSKPGGSTTTKGSTSFFRTLAGRDLIYSITTFASMILSNRRDLYNWS